MLTCDQARLDSVWHFSKRTHLAKRPFSLLTRLPATMLLATLVAAGSSLWAQQTEPASVVTWRFDSEEFVKLSPVGSVQRDQAGPRPPEFPDFDAGNLAVRLDGKGARFQVADPGTASDFDFSNGDAITLEAWINVTESLGNDRNMYIIGKGRTGNSDFQADNQNWALRIRSIDGSGRINFLFASDKTKGQATSGHWHRWTSNVGIKPGTGWHRVAVQYQFGKPESIRGWLNDKVVEGSWDMGGASANAPINDNDEIWIGSAQSGAASSSFSGLLDEVSVFRHYLSEQQMAKRFRRVGPDRTHQMQELANVPPSLTGSVNSVEVHLFEGLAAHDSWSPRTSYEANQVYKLQAETFFFPRLPKRYDDWGIIASWRSTVLLQAAAKINLPAGKHQLLLRGRGLTRLWLDDKVVAKLSTRKGASDGHQPVAPLSEPPAPGQRVLGFGDQESLVDLEVAQAGIHQIALETLVGSSKSRAEPGETLVAIKLDGQDGFSLVQPADSANSPIALDNASIERLRERLEVQLRKVDDEHRRMAAASQDKYWANRHELAQAWAQKQVVTVPLGNNTAIDAFIQQKIRSAREEAAESNNQSAEFFHTQIKPILQDNCLRCHGSKAEGGLKLTSRETALAGGDSGPTALLPSRSADSEIMTRISSSDPSVRMPPSANLPEAQIKLLKQWIDQGAEWGRVVDEKTLKQSALADDATFLRRAYLDCVGVPPTEAESREFISSKDLNKREKLIDRLLNDARLADHWVSYWQDVLAENPNILKPSLNNTGPFRYFLYESLLDHKPLDRMVSELIMLRGSEREGGSAGFGMAADNDSPLATRSIVLTSAFLGINLQCARCHDSPYHSTTQGDLFATAAMLARKPLMIPATSTVAPGFFEKNKDRQSLIKVSLKTGVPVEPKWCFDEATGVGNDEQLLALVREASDSRERLAALVTAPQNKRFAGVIVNRLWQRLIGSGIVEPIDDWENATPSHPELLDWLSLELVRSGYDMRHVIRLIMNSRLYQQQATGNNAEANYDDRFFAAPDRRRLTAEQIVDSMFAASGQPMKTEELTFDSDARRPADVMISFGTPKRAWEFGALSNERDRPSLALPRAQAVTDVLEAFGWTGSRQNAVTRRESQPNVLQPGIVAGGVMASWITRVSESSPLSELAIEAKNPETLVDSLFLRFLARYPSEAERKPMSDLLSIGFDSRLLPPDQVVPPKRLPDLSYVGWTNHLRGEANEIMIEQQQRARLGNSPDPRIESQWREAMEDVVWTLVNLPEFVWVP